MKYRREKGGNGVSKAPKMATTSGSFGSGSRIRGQLTCLILIRAD